MRIVEIKTGAKVRTVCIPDKYEKKRLRDYMKHYSLFMTALPDYVQGFVRGRNIVTNAQFHRNFQYTLSIDLKDFFACVNKDLFPALPRELEICFPLYDGHYTAMQGLPTSPFFANLAFLPYDKQIQKHLQKYFKKTRWVYTRYADDITISFNQKINIGEIISLIRETLKDSPFAINHRKIAFYNAKSGRRIVCGIAIENNTLYPTRKIRKKLRAAIHQDNKKSMEGLREFTQLKTPYQTKDLRYILKRKYHAVIRYVKIDQRFSINLSYCNLNHLPPELEHWDQNSVLNLSSNNLKSFPRWFVKLQPFVQKINIAENEFKRLPRTIFGMHSCHICHEFQHDLELCDECHQYTCQRHLKTCDVCNRSICTKDRFPCKSERCSKYVCVRHKCINCGLYNCSFHGRQCECGQDVCDDDVNECKDCDTETIHSCSICGESLCHDHGNICPYCHQWLCQDDLKTSILPRELETLKKAFGHLYPGKFNGRTVNQFIQCQIHQKNLQLNEGFVTKLQLNGDNIIALPASCGIFPKLSAIYISKTQIHQLSEELIQWQNNPQIYFTENQILSPPLPKYYGSIQIQLLKDIFEEIRDFFPKLVEKIIHDIPLTHQEQHFPLLLKWGAELEKICLAHPDSKTACQVMQLLTEKGLIPTDSSQNTRIWL